MSFCLTSGCSDTDFFFNDLRTFAVYCSYNIIKYGST